MTTGELISSVIAVVSLIVSGLTAYLTLLARFKGTVLPKHRAILTQVEGVPCLVLRCEFVNDGAKPGTIEDVLVRMRHLETGTQVVFVPYLVRDQMNVLQNYQMSDFSVFSAVSLAARQRREFDVVFRPMQAKFEPPVGTVVIHTSVCADAKTWVESSTTISLNLDEEKAKNWTSLTGASQQIQAVEISQSRRQYLERQK